MKVLKFGGTSVGSVQNFERVIHLASDGTQKIVVLSALSGTTNELVAISQDLKKRDANRAKDRLDSLRKRYVEFLPGVFSQSTYLDKGADLIQAYFQKMEQYFNCPFGEKEEKELISLGEMISTKIFHLALAERKIESVWINALDFMQIDQSGQPVESLIRAGLLKIMESCQNEKIIITQGFICRNHLSEVDNLQRGGSDYTATLIGAALDVDEIEIWSDVSGLQNNDPRFVENTIKVPEISYTEAESLAYFGAKLLHPLCLQPVKKKNIAVWLKNTLNLSERGTLISGKFRYCGVKAVSGKDKMMIIKLRSSGRFSSANFQQKVLEFLVKHNIPADMSMLSGDMLKLVMPDRQSLRPLISDLEGLAKIEIVRSQTIICITGFEQPGVEELKYVLDNVGNVPVKLSYIAESIHSILLLIDSEYKSEILNNLNQNIWHINSTPDLKDLAA